MKTYDVKNSYNPQATRVSCGREEFVNLVEINWSWHTLILYSQSLQFSTVAKSFKIITMETSLLRIQRDVNASYTQ
jgi:hypothetical protein